MKTIEPVTAEYATKTRDRVVVSVQMLDELIELRQGSDPITALVCRDVRTSLVEAANALADVLTDVEPAPRAAHADARANRDHRHRFENGVCVVAGCGKAKSPNGRKPAAAADAPPPVDPRQQPFKPIGNPDAYADGSQGSSGVVRRG
jgi:hypothetical protein